MEERNENNKRQSGEEPVDNYNSAEAWREWEEEMKQYEGWENHANNSLSVSCKRARTDGDDRGSQIKDILVSQLLEDVEARTMLLDTLVEAGVDADTIERLFSEHIRTFVMQKQSHGKEGGRIYLVHDAERNLHVSVFGWCRFRKADIDVLVEHGPFIEMGAGSGWLAFLLKERGSDVEAYDSKEQEDGTFISEWQRWPWSDAVMEGSLEKLDSADESRNLILCWPDMGSNFAISCLRRFKGNKLIYIGEDAGGETADDEFFQEIKSKWKLMSKHELDRRSDAQDHICIYEME